MSGFNREHVPVREADTGARGPGYSENERYYVIFACGLVSTWRGARRYSPAPNRKKCLRCMESGEKPIPVPERWSATRHVRTGTRPAEESMARSGIRGMDAVSLACGLEVTEMHADMMDESARDGRSCPGCLSALDPEANPRWDRSQTAPAVYRAVRSATSDPRHRELAYADSQRRSGFYRPCGGREDDSRERILEEASTLMETVSRACRASLQEIPQGGFQGGLPGKHFPPGRGAGAQDQPQRWRPLRER